MDFFIITRRYILVGPFMCLGARPKHIKGPGEKTRSVLHKFRFCARDMFLFAIPVWLVEAFYSSLFPNPLFRFFTACHETASGSRPARTPSARR
jgi:hypothetical protein